MASDTTEKKLPSLLFVCYGNVCRSPMAEGLARHSIGENARIESAGLSPVLEGATPEAIFTMGQIYGIDISRHKPRGLTDIQLELFESIIVLDAHVFKSLKSRHPSLTEKLTLWDIEDPFGQEPSAYRKAAERIKNFIDSELVPLYSS